MKRTDKVKKRMDRAQRRRAKRNEKWHDHKTRVRNGEDSQAVLESFSTWQAWKAKFSENAEEASKIVWLREFLSPRNFKLA